MNFKLYFLCAITAATGAMAAADACLPNGCKYFFQLSLFQG